MALTANNVSTMLENVRPVVIELMNKSKKIGARFNSSAKVEKVSRYFYRAPLKKAQNGVVAKVNIDEGAAPSGNGPVWTHIKGAYYTSAMVYRVSVEQEEQNSETAIVNVLTDVLKNSIPEMQIVDDITIHGDGSGVLTGSSSASADTTHLTFAGATDYLGVSMLREGLAVDVWDVNLTTKRSPTSGSAVTYITAIDPDAKTVTLNQAISGLTATDYLTFRGMDVVTSGPTSFQSTFPTSGTGGVSGDSFRHGFRYWNDTDSTRYFYSVQKSALPKIMARRVNASSAPFEWDFFRRLAAKIEWNRDGDKWKQTFGIANPAQIAAIQNLGIAPATVMVTADKFGQSKDLLPDNMGYEDATNIAGVPVIQSIRQDRSRIDFVNPENVVRCELFPMKYWDNGSGGYLHVGRDSNGAINFFKELILLSAYDYLCLDAGTNGVIDSLALPTGWDA